MTEIKKIISKIKKGFKNFKIETQNKNPYLLISRPEKSKVIGSVHIFQPYVGLNIYIDKDKKNNYSINGRLYHENNFDKIAEDLMTEFLQRQPLLNVDSPNAFIQFYFHWKYDINLYFISSRLEVDKDEPKDDIKELHNLCAIALQKYFKNIKSIKRDYSLSGNLIKIHTDYTAEFK